MTPIDIHEPIFELCHRLGIKPEETAEIIFRPDHVLATVYETRDGNKFINRTRRSSHVHHRPNQSHHMTYPKVICTTDVPKDNTA